MRINQNIIVINKYIKSREKHLNIAKKLEAMRKYKKAAKFYFKVYKYDNKILNHDYTCVDSIQNFYYVSQSFHCWNKIRENYKLTAHRYRKFSNFCMPDYNREVEALDKTEQKYYLYIDKIGTWRDTITGSEVLVKIEKWKYL